MRKFLLPFLIVPGLVTAAHAQKPAPKAGAKPMAKQQAATAANPLLKEWTGPYGGVPPFDKVQLQHFTPAIEAAITQSLERINTIANNKEAPTFDNTIVALEQATQRLEEIGSIYGVWTSNLSNEKVQALEQDLDPKLAAFSDKMLQNSALFRRIESIYNNGNMPGLNGEQQRLVWNYYTDFVRGGARLDAQQKARVAELNQQLASLFAEFNKHQLADEGERFQHFTSEADMAGLAPSMKQVYAGAAKERKLTGYAVANTRSAVEPFLTFADNRAARQKVWQMFVNRGDNGDANDNNSTITKILNLRQERAKLLGFETHAHYRMQKTMAQKPEKAMDLMMAVWEPAKRKVAEEVAEMQKLAGGNPIESWDYRYYAEKVRQQKFNISQEELKPYLELERLREGMFAVAKGLFGLEFKQITNVPVFHPDVRVWEVSSTDRGVVGLWYFDPFARKGKRSGAWATGYRQQHKLGKGSLVLESNNSNFLKPQPGQPVLISLDDASTLFHEFGHALHALNSNVTYPSLAGSSVPRDYVEFPSQLLEHWLFSEPMRQNYLRHYKTGEAMPASLIEKADRAEGFNVGFSTVELLSSALVDMQIHTDTRKDIDPDAFERETLSRLGMPKEMVMRHRLPQFGHLFSSDGYSAGYYSYLWSDMLTADAYEAFVKEGKGLMDPAVAQRLKQHIFSVGNSIDPAEGFRRFKGRDANADALMRKRHLD